MVFTTQGGTMRRYEQTIIREAQQIGLDVDAQHVAGNPEILWEIRCNTRAVLAMARDQQAAAVQRVNGGYPARLSDEWSRA
jgi:hypothetical protein